MNAESLLKSAYEIARERNIQRNNAMLASLGLSPASVAASAPRTTKAPKRHKRTNSDSNSDSDSESDYEQVSSPSKRRKTNAVPTRRSKRARGEAPDYTGVCFDAPERIPAEVDEAAEARREEKYMAKLERIAELERKHKADGKHMMLHFVDCLQLPCRHGIGTAGKGNIQTHA